MSPDPFANAWILTGPTGAGKTSLGLRVAEQLGAEIVSMDSMALYRGMDIGTAKPGPEERQRVRHHLLNVLDPWQSASVAWWLDQAAACCRDIEGRGKRVLFVGGTALYLKAVLLGLFDGPPADEALRQRLEQGARERGCQALHERLARIDPVTAGRLHPHDVRRVVRALEIWELTGRPISSWQTQWRPGAAVSPVWDKNANGHPRAWWIDLPRDELYARIDARVGRMIAAGLIEEARRLRQLPQPLSREASQALGYKELFDHLDGRAPLETTTALIRTRTRQFAKRQLSWFRHLPGCRPLRGELTFPFPDLRMQGVRTDPGP
jgi:tRNA dimethylallyltransferase